MAVLRSKISILQLQQYGNIRSMRVVYTYTTLIGIELLVYGIVTIELFLIKCVS
jgi:hypothetical protein